VRSFNFSSTEPASAMTRSALSNARRDILVIGTLISAVMLLINVGATGLWIAIIVVGLALVVLASRRGTPIHR
jgi:hypothetical protein